MLLLVWAGHETTAGHVSWALIDLVQNPEYLARCRDEADKLLGGNSGRDMTWEHARNLVLMELALKETERLHPVAFIQSRVAAADLELDGFTVPRDSFVLIAPCVAHRVPSIFPEPETYRPQRFAPSSGEQGPENGALIGFGGGFHRCAGVNFARLEMRVALAILLKKYDLELVGTVRPRAGASTFWPDELRVRYRLRREVPRFVSADIPAGTSAGGAAAEVQCPFHSARI